MDTMLLRRFQRHVLFQCECLILAVDGANTALKAHDTNATFYHFQNLLNAAANIQKACWGQRGRFANDRKPLRDSFGIADDSPFREVDMRNNYEHFDERLDRWWRESQRHNAIDFSFMPRQAVQGVDPIDWFRVYDPATGDMYFAGETFNVLQLVTEVQKILPKLREEASKPYFDPPAAPAA